MCFQVSTFRNLTLWNPQRGFTLWLESASAAPTPECHYFPGLPRWSPEIVPGGAPRLWELITPDCKVWSQGGPNQTCSPRRDLSNDVSHSQFGGQKEVNSWLLVVKSQTASLTPGPSFAHNLGYRCPNDQCEAIFDIYASRPFPMTLRTPQCEVFLALLSNSKHSGVPKDSKSSTLEVLGFTPTFGQSWVATKIASVYQSASLIA